MNLFCAAMKEPLLYVCSCLLNYFYFYINTAFWVTSFFFYYNLLNLLIFL